MNSHTFEEIIRLRMETAGVEKGEALAKSLRDLGAAGEETKRRTQGLLDNLDDTARTERAVQGYRKISKGVLELSRELPGARANVEALAKELSSTEEPSKKQQRAFDAARKSLVALEEKYDSQRTKLRGMRTELQAQGVATNNLVAAEKMLASRRDQAIAAIQREAAAARSARIEQERLSAIMNAAAEAERRATRAREAANDSIDVQARKAAQAARAQDQLRTSTAGVGNAFGGLRTAVAGAAGLLTLNKLTEGVRNVLDLGDAAEKTQRQLARMFGSDAAGRQAFAQLGQMARDNAMAIDLTTASAVKLKAFGLDPLNGTLQALVDENAAMGGSQERLEGTILAVGQAWAKQKLQGEEILQLVERGVPVWDLLQKVTGKSVAELQKLSEAGKLGRKEIAALLAEIGKVNSGAAAANANTLSGLFEQLSSRVRAFFTDVSNKGPLDFFKAQLREAITVVDGLAKSNELEQWARDVGSAITAVSSAVFGTGKFLVEHAGAVELIAKAYAAVKIGGFVSQLGALELSAPKAAAGVGLLGKTLGRLPGSIQIAVALVGLDLAIEGATKLGDTIGRNLPVTKEWETRTRALNDETRAMAEQFRQSTSQLDRFRDMQVQSAGAVAEMTDAERTRYRDGLTGLEKYLDAQVTYYETLRQIGGLNEEGIRHLQNLRGRLLEIAPAMKALDEGSQAAGDALKNKITPAAQLLANELGSIDASAAQAGTKLAELFKDVEATSVTKLGDTALAIEQIGAKSETSAAAVREGLVDALAKLSGAELLKVQTSAEAAFAAVGRGAKDSGVVMEVTLQVALRKLNVDAAKTGAAFTESGRETIATFTAVAENARASSQQIEAAFNGALANVNTKQEAEQIALVLESVGNRGQVSMDGLGRATEALQRRLAQIAIDLDPLAAAFDGLGIKSQRELDAARDAAEQFFNAIVDGARTSGAAQADVQRAYDAYARAARDAAALQTQAVRDQVEAQLRARAAALGVKDALDAVGDAGATAGARTAAAADDAAAALDNLGDAADGAASSASSLGDSADDAAGGLRNAAEAGREATGFALDMSAAFADAAAGLDGLDRITFGLAAEQKRQAEALLETIQEQNAAYDPLQQRVEQLRQQFNLLGKEQLQQLAREQQLLEQNLQRRQEQADQQRQQQHEQQASSGTQSGGVSRVEIVHKVEGSGQLSEQQLQSLMRSSGFEDTIGKIVMRALQRARTLTGG